MNARIVGILLMTAIVAGVLSVVSLPSVQDDLAVLSMNENQVLIGTLFLFIMAFACASIVIPMYSIIKRHNEGMALAAVGFRFIEGALFIVSAIMTLSLLTLSQEYVLAGSPNDSHFQTLSKVFLATKEYIPLTAAFAFCLGALMYNYIFYQSKLIPRWLSGLGLIAAILYMVAAFSIMFGIITSSSLISILLHFPTAVGEPALAGWLIVKGFDSSTLEG